MTNDPSVQSYPIILVVTQTYRVWVDDWDGEGSDKLVERLNDAGDAYELLEGKNPIDGWLDVRAPEWSEEFQEPDRLGPLPQCLGEGCTHLVYYGRYCFKHNPGRPTNGAP